MMSPRRQLEGKGVGQTALLLIAVACAALIAALVVGISDNWPGILLLYMAAIALVLALVTPWRRLRSYLILLGASLIGFPVFVVLHNLFYALGEMAGEVAILPGLLGFLEVVFFLVAVIVCPAGALVGLVGSAVMWLRRRRPA